MIDKFLYTGAAPGEKLATQQAVKNMPYSQIGKNILAEGAFGKNVGPASSLRGYDPNYTGKGAIPRNTAFQRMMAIPKYAAGAFNLGDKASNLAGGTPAQRQLYEKVLQSGIGASQAGKNVLGRVLGAALGPAATYASALAAPNMYMASMLDGPNVRSGAADEYVGMMGEAMPEEDYAGLGELLGIPEASQALDDEYYDFDKEPDPYSELDDFEAQNAGSFIPEEEKGIFSLGDILADLGSKGVEIFKDVAGRSIKSKVFGGVGTILGGPVVGGIGALAGLLTGGNMFNSSPSQSQINFDNLSPEAQAYTSSLYNPGGLLSGYNQISASGVGALGTLQNRLGTIQNTLAKQKNPSLVLQQREQLMQNAIDDIIADKDKKAGMNAPNNIGLGGGGGDSGSGDSDAGYSPGQSAGMGFGGGRTDPTDKS